jgi:predicted TIM-barrel enzyme
MSLFTREQCLLRLRAEVAAGRPIVGAGAGTGLSAKCAEAGGIDLLIIYNSGRFRMAGRGSLSGMMPYGDANAIVMEMAREVLPVVKQTPVLAGVCGTDPFRLMPLFLRELQSAGFSGVQNFPTVGLIDGLFRQNLEETDMGFDKEVAMIAEAHRLGLLTCPYVFTVDEARAMAHAGADVLIAHMGLTTKGTIGARTALTLDESAARVQSLHDAARESWSCATAAPLPSRKILRTSWSTPGGLSGSSGHQASSGYPPKRPSRRACAASKASGGERPRNSARGNSPPPLPVTQ